MGVENVEEGKAGRRRRGARVRADSEASARKEPHTTMWARDTWKRFSKMAIDLDADRSALLETWINERMNRFGPRERPETAPEESDGPANPAVEGLPDEESLTPPEDREKGRKPGQGRGRAA